MTERRVRVVSVGQRFGVRGEVLVRGRVVASTRLYPHGMDAAARLAAEQIDLDTPCSEHGCAWWRCEEIHGVAP